MIDVIGMEFEREAEEWNENYEPAISAIYEIIVMRVQCARIAFG